MTDIHKYAKLDKTCAKTKIMQFKAKYDLQATEDTMNDFIDKIKKGTQNHDEQVLKLFQFLFVFFAFMMEENYNGIIRQLCKLFLKEIDHLCRTIIKLKPEQSTGYLMAIFENQIIDKPIKRNHFDLNQMRNILLTEEQMKKMNLEESLAGTTLCELVKISNPKVKSKHVIICIAGFL